MVELGWTVVNVMYVEYVFVGHGLIDYTTADRWPAGRPRTTLHRAASAKRAARQWCSHQRRAPVGQPHDDDHHE